VAELALELERVVKRWRSGAALRGVDLAVPRGAVVGLVGPSGAGKTTAMRVGLGLLAPDEGTARVFSTPARAIARHRGRVGVLIDGPALEPALSVVDNLQVHALRHGRAAPDPAPWFEKLGLGGLARRRAARLSQGEQYRVALVRALLLGPDLLVLDEPVAHFDPALAQAALELVREASARGAATLVTSHQLAELQRVATHLVLLHKGEVLLSGALSDLLGTIAPALRIAAGDATAPAKTLLTRHAAVARVDELRADGQDLLRVELRASRPEEASAAAAAINAALHQGGIAASLLAPERPTLEELFRRTLLRAGGSGTERPA
jgi:ABC-2 type transport system ATP-binding protein